MDTERLAERETLLHRLVCVCLLLQDLLQSCSRGGRRRVDDMCDDTEFVTLGGLLVGPDGTRAILSHGTTVR